MNKRAKEILSVLVALAMVSNGSIIKVLASENNDNINKKDLDKKAINSKKDQRSINDRINNKTINEVVTIMVEVKDNYNVDEIRNKISKLGEVKFKREFSKLVRGVSIECKKSIVGDISKIEGIASISEAGTYNRAMASADAMTKAYNTWRGYGYKGEGVVVSIIDSGIDVNHKDMRLTDPSKAKLKNIKKSNETNYSIKIPYGKNFVENNDDLMDRSPITGEHGMHVAGIVAANGEGENGLKGVAPEAQLLAMKVFSENTFGCREDDIIAAIEESVEHGADIINMSLSTHSNFNDPDSMLQKSIQKATEKGVVVVVAAGNDGNMGTTNPGEYPIRNKFNLKDTSLLGDPANVLDAITVASIENTNKTIPVLYLEGNGVKEKLKYDIPNLSKGFSKEQFGKHAGIVPISNEEFEKLGEDTRDLEGKFVLIQENKDMEKLLESIMGMMQMKKIQGIIFYGDLDVKDSFKYGVMGVTTAMMVDNSTADKIKELSAKGVNMFISSDTEVISNPNIGSMSNFTSFGPTSDLEFKPDVTAPGGNIYSTLNNNRYGNMSGTSMASPHTAGAVALVLQYIKNSNLSIPDNQRVMFAKNTLLNTAEIINDIDVSKGLPYSPRRQGSGLLQIDKAIKNNVVVTSDRGIGNIALKEIGYITDFEIQLKNYGQETLSFDIDKTSIFTEKIMDDSGVFGESAIDGGALSFDSKEINLKPGEVKKIKAKLSLPVVLKSGIFVEGFIKFNSKDGKNPNLNIPYMGYFGDYANEPIFYTPKNSDKPSKDKEKLENSIKPVSLLYANSMSEIKENGFISPNGDGFKDGIIPLIPLLRNCKELIVDVVDKNNGTESVLRTLSSKKDVRRLPLSNIASMFLNSDVIWDGTFYDDESKSYKPAQEGQYYVRVRGKVKDIYSTYQTVYVPIRVDNTAPSLEILETKILKENENKFLELKFKAYDGMIKSSGIDLGPESLKVSNGNEECHIVGNVEDLGNNIYKAKLTVNSDEVKNLSVKIRDNAGNETSCLNDITLLNLNKDRVLSSRYLNEKGDIEIKASVGEKINNVIVNGSNVLIGKDRNVVIRLEKPKQGEQDLNIKLYDKDNKEVYSSTEKVFIDTVNPEIKSLENEKIKDIDNTKALYKVWGSIKETEKSFEEEELHINGQPVKIDSNGAFSGEVEVLNTGEIDVHLKDKAGNECIKSVLLEEDTEVKFESLAMKMLLLYEAKDVSSDGSFYVKGTAATGVKELYLNGDSVKIKEDGTFTKKISLKQGLNKLLVKVIDKNKNSTNSVKYVLWDDIAPELKLNLDSLKDKNGNVYVEGNEFSITGSIKDNTYGCKLNINGNEVINTNIMLNMGNPVGDDVFRERSFNHTIKLSSKETIVNIQAEDFMGNKVIKTYNIIKK